MIKHIKFTENFQGHSEDFLVVWQTNKLREEFLIIPDANGWYFFQDQFGNRFTNYGDILSEKSAKDEDHNRVFERAIEIINQWS